MNYKEVKINGPEDLPEDAYDKEYIVHSRDGWVGCQPIYWKQDDLDWYLLPVKEMTDDEIEIIADKYFHKKSKQFPNKPRENFIAGMKYYRDR